MIYARARECIKDVETGSIAEEGDSLLSITFFDDYNNLVTIDYVEIVRIGHYHSTFLKNNEEFNVRNDDIDGFEVE